MNRGDQREAIFRDDEDRQKLLTTLGEACMKTEWQVQAYCLNDHEPEMDCRAVADGRLDLCFQPAESETTMPSGSGDAAIVSIVRTDKH